MSDSREFPKPGRLDAFTKFFIGCVAGFTVVLVAATSCGGAGPVDNSEIGPEVEATSMGLLTAETITVAGQDYLCIVYSGDRQGGLWCERMDGSS